METGTEVVKHVNRGTGCGLTGVHAEILTPAAMARTARPYILRYCRLYRVDSVKTLSGRSQLQVQMLDSGLRTSAHDAVYVEMSLSTRPNQGRSATAFLRQVPGEVSEAARGPRLHRLVGGILGSGEKAFSLATSGPTCLSLNAPPATHPEVCQLRRLTDALKH